MSTWDVRKILEKPVNHSLPALLNMLPAHDLSAFCFLVKSMVGLLFRENHSKCGLLLNMQVTMKHPRNGMIGSADEAQLMRFLIRLVNAEKVIEIGKCDVSHRTIE